MTKRHAIVALVAIATSTAPAGCFGTLGAVAGHHSASTRNRQDQAAGGVAPKHRSVAAWSFAGLGIGLAIDVALLAAVCIDKCHGD
jgi:hypothetical protein